MVDKCRLIEGNCSKCKKAIRREDLEEHDCPIDLIEKQKNEIQALKKTIEDQSGQIEDLKLKDKISEEKLRMEKEKT